MDGTAADAEAARWGDHQFVPPRSRLPRRAVPQRRADRAAILIAAVYVELHCEEPWIGCPVSCKVENANPL